MLLREALRACSGAKLSPRRRAALLCSFEPLHLQTFLQARLALASPEETPAVAAFGFDQLENALAKTETELAASPALLFLTWADLHPGLSWRSRGELGPVPAEELARMGARLRARLESWLKARAGAQSCLMLAPADWLGPFDSQPSGAWGPTALAASAELAALALSFARAGGRVLRTPSLPFNYRDFLLGGFPLHPDGADAVAKAFVDSCFSARARKKALVVDLDETVWSGVIGEDGPAALRHAPEGKGFAHHVLQKFLLKLKREGVLLAFCSKNNPDEVLPHFDALNMPLKLSDFAASRCNWEPKPENLRALAAELNIGLDALVFLDDNEVELGEVRQRLPEVEALKTPVEGQAWQELFARLQDLFGAWRVGDEDSLRASAPRPALPADSAPGGYLREMELELSVNPTAFQDPRSLELVNKTNQFNLTGERFSPEDWLHWSKEEGAFCLSAKLRDRFGDFGTVCVVAGKAEGTRAFVRQFVLSCRAFGRAVENLMLGEVVRAFPGGLGGAFKETPKNEPARRFLSSLGCAPGADGRWSLSADAARTQAQKALELTGARLVRA
ncbi:MAG TPA: HAD-IIIC family phosphatase [Elusimicrobiota bacterium]|nr:HAD-IIIC family phosphatase [Elusimicrobiota bacterium]